MPIGATLRDIFPCGGPIQDPVVTHNLDRAAVHE